MNEFFTVPVSLSYLTRKFGNGFSYSSWSRSPRPVIATVLLPRNSRPILFCPTSLGVPTKVKMLSSTARVTKKLFLFETSILYCIAEMRSVLSILLQKPFVCIVPSETLSSTCEDCHTIQSPEFNSKSTPYTLY